MDVTDEIKFVLSNDTFLIFDKLQYDRQAHDFH